MSSHAEKSRQRKAAAETRPPHPNDPRAPPPRSLSPLHSIRRQPGDASPEPAAPAHRRPPSRFWAGPRAAAPRPPPLPRMGPAADHARRIVAEKKLFDSREWRLAIDTEAWWTGTTSKMWTNMWACATCGECAFARVRIPMHDTTNSPPQVRCRGTQLPASRQPPTPSASAPYAAQCAAVADACLLPNGKWSECRHCNYSRSKLKQPPRSAMQPAMTPEISRDLCGLAPAAAQLLSPVDACVSFG